MEPSVACDDRLDLELAPAEAGGPKTDPVLRLHGNRTVRADASLHLDRLEGDPGPPIRTVAVAPARRCVGVQRDAGRGAQSDGVRAAPLSEGRSGGGFGVAHRTEPQSPATWGDAGSRPHLLDSE